MSYSMRVPDEPPECECRYDEARDEMDREDCPFHCDWLEDTAPPKRKQPATEPEQSSDKAVA